MAFICSNRWRCKCPFFQFTKVLQRPCSVRGTNQLDVEELESKKLETELHDVRDKLSMFRSGGKYVPLEMYGAKRANFMLISDLQQSMWCEKAVEYQYLGQYLHSGDIRGFIEYRLGSIDSAIIHLLSIYKQLYYIKTGKGSIPPGFKRFYAYGKLFDPNVIFIGAVKPECLRYHQETKELVLYSSSVKSMYMAKHQQVVFMLYKLLLDDVVSGNVDENFMSKGYEQCLEEKVSKYLVSALMRYDLVRDFKCVAPQVRSLTYGEVFKHMNALMKSLNIPRVSKILHLYNNGETLAEVPFDKNWVKQIVEDFMPFWEGKRFPQHPDFYESWKCSGCFYKEICTWGRKVKRDL